MPPEQNEADLAGLSDQERAALQEDSDDEATLRAIADKKGPDDADDGNDTVAGGSDGPGDDDDADDDAGDQTGKGADAKGAEGKGKEGAEDPGAKATADAAAAAKATAEAGAATAPAEQPAVVFTATAPEDAAEQIKTLRGEKAAEFKKLMDGDITPEQYSAKEDEILGKISDLDRAVTKAETAADFTVQQAQRSYIGKVNALLDNAKKNDGIDYRATENKGLHEELDRTVKWLASDPTNADKPEQWFLDEAHTMVKVRHGLGKAPAAPAAPDNKKATGGKAPDLAGLPPSLRNVPPAADSDDGGEFAHLSSLTGMALERELSKMTPEQTQRYLEA